MNAYSIGLSALQAGQQALEVIGQNVANANTPGYSRQEASLVSQGNGSILEGVSVAQVLQSSDTPLQAAIYQSAGASSLLSTRLSNQQAAQSAIAPGSNGINTLLSNLFSSITELTSNPGNATQQGVVVATASSLALGLNSAATQLSEQSAGINTQIQQAVTQVNTLTSQIANLNTLIAEGKSAGQSPSELIDQRGQLVTQLSQLTDIQVTNQPNGSVNIMGGGTPLVDGPLPGSLSITSGAAGAVTITETSSGLAFNPTGGSLGGLLQDINVSLPSYQSQLNTLAQSLMSQFDEVQATGLGAGGPVTSMTGTRGVANTTATLSSQNLPIPAQSGTLYISVTNTATGQTTLDPIAIDPTTQSLQNVASAITAGTGGNIQATVNSVTGTLQLQAQPGFQFDFAGTLPTTPPTQNLNGTTTAQVSGNYTGASNDNYSFQVLGNGTIGTTAGLQLQVTNSAGTVVSTVNVGAGYTPGAAISIGNGLSVSLSAGTSNNGTFSTPVISQPDTSGILASLGINSLFSGSDATDIAVNSAITANPALLNTGVSGQPGDTTNLQRMAAIQNATALGNGTQTLGGYFAQLTGAVGGEVSSLTDQQSAQTNLGQNLQTQYQSETGVDVNSEMLNLLSFQQMMESASKYLSVVNSTMQSVINVIQ